MKRFGEHGFTMLELMIVVLIISVLSAIAIPSYRSYVLRSHRIDAKRNLADIASREERYYYSNNTYPSSSSSLFGSDTFPTSPYYTFTVPSATSTGYTVTATVTSEQSADTSCSSFSQTQAGVQSSLNASNADSTSTCW